MGQRKDPRATYLRRMEQHLDSTVPHRPDQHSEECKSLGSLCFTYMRERNALQ